jgi:hypothetical protein
MMFTPNYLKNDIVLVRYPFSDLSGSKVRPAIATLIMEELASERQWAEAFSKSQDELAKLAEEALEEFKQGKTKPWDFINFGLWIEKHSPQRSLRARGTGVRG